MRIIRVMKSGEPKLDDLPIVDTHLHLWDPERLRYPWLDAYPDIRKPYVLEDFLAATAGLRIERAIFVQADCDPAHYRDEVGWVASLAAVEPRIAGIVSYAPLEKGDESGSEIVDLAGRQAVCGVRRLLQSEADGFCLRPAFIAGVRLLAEHELNFDICIRHGQLDQVIELVDRCPGVRFVLDHAAKPDIRGRSMSPWKERIAQFAERPDTWCKLSGLTTEADLRSWKPEDLQPYIEHVVACFGVERVMFGSDWPVALLATGYRRWVETLRSALSALPTRDVRKIFRDNALACYRLIG